MAAAVDPGPRGRDERKPCEFCMTPLVDPIEEPYNLAFIAHLRATPRCMELFSYGMTNLRNEMRARVGKKPTTDGL
ncbi:MAG TPA: hypothetical protein VM889_13945 [Candidatus Thermoplasmatota archaeon]|nr:hypothetical protein [Candidatus Thermoplasmatota archaeon]